MLYHALQDVLTDFGVCLGYRPKWLISCCRPFTHGAVAAAYANSEDPATITLFGGKWVEWAEFRIRR